MWSDNLMNLRCGHYSKAVIRGGGYHSMVLNVDLFRGCTFELFNDMLGCKDPTSTTQKIRRVVFPVKGRQGWDVCNASLLLWRESLVIIKPLLSQCGTETWLNTHAGLKQHNTIIRNHQGVSEPRWSACGHRWNVCMLRNEGRKSGLLRPRSQFVEASAFFLM